MSTTGRRTAQPKKSARWLRIQVDDGERPAVASVLKLTESLGVKPEELGLRRDIGGAYYVTYQCYAISAGLAKRLGIDKSA